MRAAKIGTVTNFARKERAGIRQRIAKMVTVPIFAIVCTVSFAQQDSATLWKPAEDNVFLQEIGEKISTEEPITALALDEGELLAIIGGHLKVLRDGGFVDEVDAPEGAARMWALGGDVWVAADSGTSRRAIAGWSQVSEHSFVDMCLHEGAVHGATRDDIYRFYGGAFTNIKPESGFLSSDSTLIMADGSQVLADPIRIGPIDGIESYSSTIYLIRSGRIALLNGDALQHKPIDWGMLTSDRLRDVQALGSRFYIATDRGVGVLRGMALTTLTGDQGLPYDDTTCLARGFDGDLWIGTTTGAIRKTGDDFHYFGAHHWLPGNNVHAIAVGDHVAYIATDAGLGIIRYEPYTLRKKAAYFERALDEWGYKRLGFVHKLFWSGDEDGWLREISDNDGGHTAHYLAAMSFKYGATGDADARREAVDAFEAMIWLEDITQSDGFVARAIWSPTADKGRRSTRGSGGLPAKWYESDDKKWQWKGDTSSDEINAHIYSVSVFHDLVAKGAEKERAAEHIARIGKHIIDNGWVLRDMDGEATRWGRWDPEYLLQPYGFEARGLNGMEAQSYMWTAIALSDDPVFRAGLQQLLDWGYHTYTVRQKMTFPQDAIVTWDDELAFRCYYPLLMYADDPKLRSIYLRSLERSWEVMRMQKLPFFNFVYGALTGNDCEIEPAVQHLREWSLDTASHSYRNSHRTDLATEPGYVPYSGGTRAISPRELEAEWGSRTAIRYNGGSGGRSVTPPVGWLEDYWMGRYHGFIEKPATSESELVAVPNRKRSGVGAKPYDGPERPKFK